MSRRQNDASAAGRDIGQIPKVKNPERRESCRYDLELFGKTYNPAAFSMEFGSIHRDCIARIQEAVLDGALYAFAMPRGSGKSTICRTAAWWANSYSHCRYSFLIGSTEGKGIDSLDAVKTFMRFMPDYVDDFPEISYPVIKLGGIAHRCNGQHINGQPTMMVWSKDKVVLPTVLDKDGNPYPSSGSIIGASGLTGEGIRGSLFTKMTGEQVRPDFVLLDDPQTDKSANSNSQNVSRTKLISGAVLGMAGPGKKISAVMPCTVIANGDMVDQILDRKKHPLWRGSRTKMLESMPTNMDAWEKYFEVYRNASLMEPPDLTLANDYYTENRKSLDEGASVTWEARKEDSEVSAIQNAMNIYCRDPDMFMAEYQNEPVSDEAQFVRVTIDMLEKRPKDIDRLTLPNDTEYITSFIDISDKVLWYMVCAWKKNFTGSIVDYGVFPEQATTYTTLSSARRTLKHLKPKAGFEAYMTNGLTELCEMILGREYYTENNNVMKMSLCLIDSGWGTSTETVYNFCRRSSFTNILLPSKGVGVTAGRNMLVDPAYKRKPGESLGGQWRITNTRKGARLIQYDTNHWKSFCINRMAEEPGNVGSLAIHKGSFSRHRMLYEQLTSEYSVRTTGRGRVVDEFHMKPNRDNHLLDCLVGCGVGASVRGCSISKTLIQSKKVKDGNSGKKKNVSYF